MKDNLNKTVDFESSMSVYDIEDKKLVLVFKNLSIAYEYLFNKRVSQGRDSSSKLKRWIEDKKRKVLFDRLVCFRWANTEQRKLIGEKEVLVILDERFKRNDLTMNLERKISKHV